MGAKERWESIKNEARPYAGLAWWVVIVAVVALTVSLVVELYAA
jgi:hypothetical protein